MNRYQTIITILYLGVSIYLYSNEIAEDFAPLPIKATIIGNTIINKITHDEIEFNCHHCNTTKGRYWQKTEFEPAFAYIKDNLYKDIIESDTILEEKTSFYLGHFINQALKTIYLYGIQDKSSLSYDQEDEIDIDDEDDN